MDNRGDKIFLQGKQNNNYKIGLINIDYKDFEKISFRFPNICSSALVRYGAEKEYHITILS